MRSETASGTGSSGRRRAIAGSGPVRPGCPCVAIRDGSAIPLSRRSVWRGVAAAAGWLAAVAVLATCEATTGPKAGHVQLTYAGDTTLTAGVHTLAAVTATVDGSAY